MADEVVNAGEGEQQTDQSGAIAKLFGSGEEAKPETPETTAAGDGSGGVELPEQYQEGRVPKQFHREDGKHDYEGMTKSWFELRKGHAEQSARVKELEGQLRTTDEPWEAYSGDFDWEAVKQRAPNAYLGGEAENEAAMSLLKHLHVAGVPKAKAAKAVADYYADLDKLVGQIPTEEEQRKAAVGHLGVNGAQMAQEVQTWLTSRSSVKPFPEDELRELGRLTRSGPGLSLLWQFMRSGTNGSGPPTGQGTGSPVVDPEKERVEARRGLGVSDEEWKTNRAAAIARWAQANGVDPSELRGA